MLRTTCARSPCVFSAIGSESSHFLAFAAPGGKHPSLDIFSGASQLNHENCNAFFFFFSLPFTAQQKQVNGLNKCVISSSTRLSKFIITLHPFTAALLSAQRKCLLWITTLLRDFSFARKSAACQTLVSLRNSMLQRPTSVYNWGKKKSSPVASFVNFKFITETPQTHPNK